MPCVTLKFDPAIGPIAQVGFGPPASIKSLGLSQAAAAAAPTVKVYPALVDTGASITCISAQIAQSEGLVLAGKRSVSSATQTVAVNAYMADVILAFGVPSAGTPAQAFVTPNVTVMEFISNSPHYQVLLGRDVLCRGHFVMTGYDRRFTICI